VTRLMAPVVRRIAGRSQHRDAHKWPRSGDRRATRPRGRVKYGYSGVQETGCGTEPGVLQVVVGNSYHPHPRVAESSLNQGGDKIAEAVEIGFPPIIIEWNRQGFRPSGNLADLFEEIVRGFSVVDIDPERDFHHSSTIVRCDNIASDGIKRGGGQ
jgi:hypothetical protein